jgi:FKBP-type peptidyl-prolyl cis-trans isomerase FkpA
MLNKMINKIYSFLLVAIIAFSSCEKETRDLKEVEDDRINEYLQKNNLSFQKDTSGYYYQIITPGAEDKVAYSDAIFYLQDIKVLGGKQISNSSTLRTSSDTYSFTPNYLGYVTPSAFRESMKKLGKGGKIRIIVPSYLAFGKNGYGSLIAGNTILDATLEVIDGADQDEVEDNLLLRYANTLSDTYVRDTSGVYYSIINAGTGTEEVKISSTIKAVYKGTLFNGVVFDESTASKPLEMSLSSLVPGWQYAVPKIKKGGKIKVLIPSYLAYGSSARNLIPAYSPLYFEIELLDVTN